MTPARPLVLGTLGSALVAWGTCHPEFSHGPAGWPNPVVDAIGATIPWPWDWIVIVVGVVALCWAWWLLRPDGTTSRFARVGVLALGLWSAPLLLAPPILSADAVLYADLGWIVQFGLNPYIVGLAGAGGPFAPQVDALWVGSGVAYPPLALEIDRLVVVATGAQEYFAVVAMRIPAMLAVAAMVWLVPRIARLLGRDGAAALWLGALNPLVVLHFVGGAHNDAPMVALALAGIWVALRRPGVLWSVLAGPVLIGLAMACKQPAGLAVFAAGGLPVAAEAARLPWWPRVWLLLRRVGPAALVAVAVFVAVSAASGLGFGWTKWLQLMGNTGTPAPFSIIGKLGTLAIQAAGGDPGGYLAAVGMLSTLTLLGVLGWVLVRFSDRPLAAVGWGSLAISVLGQSLHPWYVPWSVALLACVPLSARQRRWVIGFVLAFVIWNAIQTVVWHSMP